jgi:hypothetical protein
MKAESLNRRLADLEAGLGSQTAAANSPEDELTQILIEAYYNGRVPQLTPAQEQMLNDTVRWYRDEGLDYLLEGMGPWEMK